MTRAMEIAEDVLDIVGSRAEVEAHVSVGHSALTRFANSFIHQNVAEDAAQVTVRLAAGGRVASNATTNVSPEGLLRAVDDALALAALRPVDDAWPGLGGPVDLLHEGHHDPATAGATPDERARLVAGFVAAGEGLRGAGYCDTEAAEVAYANSSGRRAAGRSTRATIDGIHQSDTSAGSGHATSMRIGDLDASATGALAAARARDGAEPFDLEPGHHEVVLAPECVATMAIFLGYYGFNGKAHAEGLSFAHLGEQQFDRHFDLYDDATEPEALGVAFDHEGTPKRRIDLVTGGVTSALAHDRRTARAAGTVSTGHGLAGSEVWGPFPYTLFVGEGDGSEESLIASVERGLYVATFNYCRVLDPKSLAVTGLSRNGTFLIEHGEITGAVSGLRFTQSFVQALGPGRVLGIGGDARYADSEFGAGLVHAPSLHLADWHFTGGADG